MVSAEKMKAVADAKNNEDITPDLIKELDRVIENCAGRGDYSTGYYKIHRDDVHGQRRERTLENLKNHYESRHFKVSYLVSSFLILIEWR